MLSESMSSETGERVTFPLLADPAAYEASTWDLLAEPQKRAYWLGLFREHFPKLLAEAVRCETAAGVDEGEIRQRTERARQRFFTYLDEVTAEPAKYGKLDILEICLVREQALRQAGIDDPYRLAKRIENDTALELLPGLLKELDALDGDALAEALIRGVFAGNIFDLGATKTADLFKDGGRVDFRETRAKLKPRPWFIDDLDAWIERWRGRPHRAAVLFVDNAGPDIVLGMIPFARALLRRGTRVILTANTTPSLNDVTHEELGELIDRVAGFDEPIRTAHDDGRLRPVPSGNGAPLIDLKRISPELADAVAAEPIDLVVIEGMGRAIETNLHARLTPETIKIAMIKDPGVSDALGGELYDLVMRYEPASPATA